MPILVGDLLPPKPAVLALQRGRIQYLPHNYCAMPPKVLNKQPFDLSVFLFIEITAGCPQFLTIL